MTIAEAVRMVAAAGCTITVGSLVLARTPDNEFVIYCHHRRSDGEGWWTNEEWFEEGCLEQAANRFVERAYEGSCISDTCVLLPRRK